MTNSWLKPTEDLAEVGSRCGLPRPDERRLGILLHSASFSCRMLLSTMLLEDVSVPSSFCWNSSFKHLSSSCWLLPWNRSVQQPPASTAWSGSLKEGAWHTKVQDTHRPMGKVILLNNLFQTWYSTRSRKRKVAAGGLQFSMLSNNH